MMIDTTYPHCCTHCEEKEEMIERVLSRHEKIILLCSGGKDSMASLFLVKKWWPKINVIWVNTGATFPEAIEMMEYVKNIVPKFQEIKTDQPGNIASYGYPSEIVPVHYTHDGQIIAGKKPLKIQSYIDCCNRNIWTPSFEVIKESGATLVIRGQRNEEVLKGPLKSGEIVDGIEYLYPIEDWSRQDVMDYLKEQNFKIPDHYKLSATSLDCWNCTAYCYEHKDKLHYMKEHHPIWHDEYKARLDTIRKTIFSSMETLNTLLEETTNE